MRAVLPVLCSLHLCFEPQLQYQCLHSVDKVAHCHYHQQNPTDHNLANSKKKKVKIQFTASAIPTCIEDGLTYQIITNLIL